MALVVVLGGCATLDRGTTDMVFVVSDPPGAQARSSLGPRCMTPCGLKVGRRDAFTVTVEKAGFQPQSVTVTTRPNALGVGDMMEDVATAGLGAVVDAATGAELEHVPDPVTVTLRPSGAVAGVRAPRPASS